MAAADVLVYGLAGVASVAALGTTLPTDATTAFSAGTSLGEISGEDGFEDAYDSEGEVVARRWTGEPLVIATPETTETYTFTCLEESEQVREFVRPGTVTDNAQLSGVPSNAGQVFVFTVRANSGAYKRIVVPRGVVTSREPVLHANGEVTAYKVTVTAIYDATLTACSKTYWSALTS